MSHRLIPAALLGLLALLGPAAAFDGRGIGGTGIDNGDGRGIGGTGIVGTITGFGSVYVNGLEVHYPEGQPVGIFGTTGTAADLKVGQVVAIEAAEDSDGRLTARSMEVRHALAGPVTAVDPDRGTMEVMGRTVRLGEAAGEVPRPKPGDWVAVSGLTDADGAVVASRLDKPPAGTPAFLRGTVTSLGDGRVGLDGVPVALGVGLDPKAFEVGREVTLYGQPEGRHLMAARFHADPDSPFGGRVKRLVVEGYADRQGRRLGGLNLPEDAKAFVPGQRVILNGNLGADRRLRKESIEALPPRWQGGQRPGEPRRIESRPEPHKDRKAIQPPPQKDGQIRRPPTRDPQAVPERPRRDGQGLRNRTEEWRRQSVPRERQQRRQPGPRRESD